MTGAQAGPWTCILGVWTCILGVWICILGAWTHPGTWAHGPRPGDPHQGDAKHLALCTAVYLELLTCQTCP